LSGNAVVDLLFSPFFVSLTFIDILSLPDFQAVFARFYQSILTVDGIPVW
jgi:hypothetical protein